MSGRMKKTVAGMAVAILAVAGGATVLAQPGPDGPGRGMFGRHGFGRSALGLPLHGLDLTEEQRTQVRSIVEKHRDEARQAGERVRAAFKAQQDAVTAVPLDEGAIRARSSELAAAQAESAIVRARIHSEVFQVLTPEQQQKAQQLRSQREERMKQRRAQMERRRQR